MTRVPIAPLRRDESVAVVWLSQSAVPPDDLATLVEIAPPRSLSLTTGRVIGGQILDTLNGFFDIF